MGGCPRSLSQSNHVEVHGCVGGSCELQRSPGQYSSWAAVRRLDASYWATLADGGADEAQAEAREVMAAGELKCACMTKSERGAYLRLRLKRLGEGSTGRGGPGPLRPRFAS